ncbi:GNAT family N-acetyltransferase [Kitasatospora aureofaciens]|uniref:GNAT family N-acetyltransferase n=1 Tax=Kitasatospora aureofaciens TaxID=1894 RepID=UPI001C484344|nr:GNAT family N-acetyltransferase [Kitasatospora aureofaciens]MBV6700902.1 GNAT family N-acetyltransferase [Kitasatospora aureofaciens]
MALSTELTHAWVHGLAAARQCPVPVEVPWGLRVDVGRRRESVRHVLLHPDEASLRAAGDAADRPFARVKGFVDPELGLQWLGPEWESSADELMMTAALSRQEPVQLPAGYEASAETADGVTRVQVRTAAGEVAAGGFMAVRGHIAVVDRVETDTAHQRRGLGSAVMRLLSSTAAEAGAETAILGATEEGRALYESLGWELHGLLAGFVRRT